MNKIYNNNYIWNMLINTYLEDIRNLHSRTTKKRIFYISLIIFSLAMSEQQSFPYMPSRFLLTYDSLRSAQKYN